MKYFTHQSNFKRIMAMRFQVQQDLGNIIQIRVDQASEVVANGSHSSSTRSSCSTPCIVGNREK